MSSWNYTVHFRDSLFGELQCSNFRFIWINVSWNASFIGTLVGGDVEKENLISADTSEMPFQLSPPLYSFFLSLLADLYWCIPHQQGIGFSRCQWRERVRILYFVIYHMLFFLGILYCTAKVSPLQYVNEEIEWLCSGTYTLVVGGGRSAKHHIQVFI